MEAELDRKQQNNLLRKKQTFQRFGRVQMERSAKVGMKKVEAPKEEDPEKIAFRTYIGQLEEVAEEGQATSNQK